MTIHLEFDGELPTLNQYIHKSNQSRWAAATLKRDYTEECSLVFQAQARGRKRVEYVTIDLIEDEGGA